ncbi:unnamed protein product [Callosobruchus maculatus]|uniref:Uncharacterized protein n=1 Tax=Callosobruchus maculatus TaxID=64391 RepID=A0A653C5T7_CALMS|nr:unnamed protein product [Callosobruchus maculatus]
MSFFKDNNLVSLLMICLTLEQLNIPRNQDKDTRRLIKMSFCGGVEFCWIMGIKKRNYPSLLDEDELTKRRKGERYQRYDATVTLPGHNFSTQLSAYQFTFNFTPFTINIVFHSTQRYIT